mgnify:CR=1 FL=1
MVEIHLEESDRLDWALKAFKRKIAKAGILKDLRKKRYYVKPSEARQLKAAAARRRSRTEREHERECADRTRHASDEAPRHAGTGQAEVRAAHFQHDEWADDRDDDVGDADPADGL